MSGHSKWHNIQAKKGKADKAKSSQFTKIARFITVAAKQGGGDPTMNFSLRLAVEKAKEVNMPKENIERAIKKGTGELKDDAVFEEVVYEGFGPGGVAIIIEALTDNRNRTNSEVRNIATKNGGNIGASGSVQWQFQHLGVVRLDESQKSKVKTQKPDYELDLIEAGASDFQESEFGLEIYCPIENFQKVMETVQRLGGEPTDSGLEWVPKETVTLDSEASTQLEKLTEALEDFDDVRAVYTNQG